MQRLELKAERDSVGVVEEILNASITEALEEREQQETSEGQHTLFSARLYSIYNFFLTQINDTACMEVSECPILSNLI